jgi:hypothetical protein
MCFSQRFLPHESIRKCIVIQPHRPENRTKAVRGDNCARSAAGSVTNRISVSDDRPVFQDTENDWATLIHCSRTGHQSSSSQVRPSCLLALLNAFLVVLQVRRHISDLIAWSHTWRIAQLSSTTRSSVALIFHTRTLISILK